MNFHPTSSPQGATLGAITRRRVEQGPATTKKPNADECGTVGPGFGDPARENRPLGRVAILETIRPSGQWSEIMKPPSFFGWYEILRTRHRWTVLQSIRYALWLARSSENRRAGREAHTIESNPQSQVALRLRSCSESFRFGCAASDPLRGTESELHHVKVIDSVGQPMSGTQ